VRRIPERSSSAILQSSISSSARPWLQTFLGNL
jgi:hypothetical protein